MVNVHKQSMHRHVKLKFVVQDLILLSLVFYARLVWNELDFIAPEFHFITHDEICQYSIFQLISKADHLASFESVAIAS